MNTGNNEYGSWIKYSNGILIQYGVGSNNIIQFPINFIDTKYTINLFPNVPSVNCYISRVGNKEKNRVSYRVMTYENQTVNNPVEYIAIGNWK